MLISASPAVYLPLVRVIWYHNSLDINNINNSLLFRESDMPRALAVYKNNTGNNSLHRNETNISIVYTRYVQLVQIADLTVPLFHKSLRDHGINVCNPLEVVNLLGNSKIPKIGSVSIAHIVSDTYF